MAKKPMKAPPKGGKVVKRATGGGMPQGLQPGGPMPGMPSQSAAQQMGQLQQMAARPMSQAGMAAAQAAQMAGPGGLRGGPPMRSAPMRGAPMGAARAKGGKVVKKASGGTAKKRPYDAMRDESSRAIDAMPYTEDKPKPKPKPKPAPKPAPKAAPKPAPKRSADWYMKNETAMPGKFKRGGKIKAKKRYM